ncbi:tetratricopeptide repeat protein [Paucibacter sp. B2R-40]|uniref:nuclear transport factor 2 family protein n=1 Tax=Paucibacter sp. B2R-40 TaxID=2893554 RepID=UPI0021E43E7A|nr:tetratricopeptide repeat protein [Paucibacter sp. B2R-40]MCV2356665.1 tetratricopeptide repeat protein [Paucibacter sp. B2R-40]
MSSAATNHRPLSWRLLPLYIACALAAGLPTWARADDVGDVQALLSGGKVAEGLKKVDDLLKAKPTDARLRLQRGIALSLLGRNPEAIEVFKKLVVSHPEMPGPYNNLAVLYANQGDYEKARQSLEQAVRANPDYATAYQNLGDIHARLAEKAYAKSLSLDKTDLALPLKIAAVQNIFEPGAPARANPPVATPAPSKAPGQVASPLAVNSAVNPPAKPAANPSVTSPAPAAVAKTAAESAKSADPLTSAVLSSLATQPPKAASSQANLAKATQPAAALVAGPAAAKPATAVVAAAKVDSKASDSQAVRSAVDAWAAAWSKRDMWGYFAAYAPEFKGKLASRKAWEADRVARISSKKEISVVLSDVQVKFDGSTATVTFKQDYRADALKMKNDKTLELLKGKTGDWQITSENSN